jgi:chaperonin GroES
MQLKPLDDRVVVEPMDAETTTAGGIVLPDTAKEKPQRGTVKAIGPGRLLDSGERCTLSVAVGDQVLFSKYGGTDIEIDGKDVKILRESDILAKLAAKQKHRSLPTNAHRSSYTWQSNCCLKIAPG